MSEVQEPQVDPGEQPVEAPETPPEPEPENPDAEPVPEPEPIEPPSEQPQTAPEPQGLSEKEREKQQKDLDKEAKRHADTVSRLLGADAEDVTECPFCDPQLLGFFFDAQLAQPRSEMQARMIEALSLPMQAEYKDAPHASRCEDCDGYGVVLSGSRKPGNDTVVCPTCKGNGYVTDPRFTSNGVVPTGDQPALVAVGGSEPVIEDADAWGSPRVLPDGQENPNYGRMPQYKNPNLP